MKGEEAGGDSSVAPEKPAVDTASKDKPEEEKGKKEPEKSEIMTTPTIEDNFTGDTAEENINTIALSFTGRIKDADGMPLAGVEVLYKDKPIGNSSQNGDINLSHRGEKGEVFTLKMRKPGYKTWRYPEQFELPTGSLREKAYSLGTITMVKE